MAEDQLDANLGISRRTLIKRGAIVGGAVWAAPAITSFGSRALGQEAGTPVGNDISFVALYLSCGDDFYRIKWEGGGLSAVECGPTFAIDGCVDQLHRNESQVVTDCPPGVSASFNATTGSLTVNLGSCTLVDYVVKCGVPADPADQGCIDPGQDSNQPSAPQTGGSVTFVECTFPE